MNIKATVFGAVALAATTSASAQINTFVAGQVFGLGLDESPADTGFAIPAEPSSSILVTAIIDVDGDGLGDLGSFDGSSFLPDSDDLIVTDAETGEAFFELTGNGDGAEVTNAGFAPSLGFATLDVPDPFNFVIPNVNTDSVAGPGDEVFLVFYAGLDLSDLDAVIANGPGAGVAFGVLSVGFLPSSAAGVFFPAATVSSLDAAFPTNFTTVPEPASLALIGLGSIAMIARRKRA